MKKYVLTGGPGVGKTTLVEILKGRGYYVVPEAARVVMEEEKKKGSNALPWFDLSKFQELVAGRQLAEEAKASGDIVFLDRGLVDGIAYCDEGNIEAPAEALANARNRYDKIFMLEKLPSYENDSERWESGDFQNAIHERIMAAYLKFGYEPVTVPVLPLEKRADFIIESL